MDYRSDINSAQAAGVIFKAAQLGTQDVTEAELREINKFTMETLTAEDVFVFSAILCDNELDRQYERFTEKALKDLQKLFVGKTVIKDHFASADNQVARIYSTELVATEKATTAGEAYMQLKAHCYMVKTDGNKDLITEIKAGIKKEGSVGFRAASAICSICGTDNVKEYCRHWPGKTYKKEGGDTVCTFKLDSCSDAYEFSLVAVPAQRAAGVSKCYMGVVAEEPAGEPAKPAPGAKSAEPEDAAEQELMLRARISESKIKNKI